jgi:epoxyqueuosine reductase
VSDLRPLIRAEAERLGATAVGFASTETPIDPDGRMRSWVGAGFHADMGWLADSADKRLDPGLVLEGCRSVVVLAFNYNPYPDGQPPERPSPRHGLVARYAVGLDYHNHVTRRARKLAKFIREQLSGETYLSVDSGLSFERAWAARAGLGFVGKNACVIIPGTGSWVLLATILTTLPLEADTSRAPAARRDALTACGSCRLCLDACPTGALVAPFQLDARRCISWQTIEKRGPFTEVERAQLGDHFFGCDDCQSVCPYNARAPLATDPGFMPRDGRPWVDLDAVAALTDEQVDQVFRGTAIRRAFGEGLRRNARALLGANT